MTNNSPPNGNELMAFAKTVQPGDLSGDEIDPEAVFKTELASTNIDDVVVGDTVDSSFDLPPAEAIA